MASILARSGFVPLLIIVALGSFRAFIRNGNDFNVFYAAWKLVLSGRGLFVYRESPDRYLYSPGFAWILSPIAFLPKEIALGLWCMMKAGVIVYLIKALSDPWLDSSKSRFTLWGLTAWGVVMLSRPLLIDLEYGQVNLFLLGVTVWGLVGHFTKDKDTRKDRIFDFLRWFALAFVAIAKLFALPLIGIPWLLTKQKPRERLKWERWGVVLGGLCGLLIPLLTEGWSGAFELILGWRDALLSRGAPMESHNQSFMALLFHYLSGIPIHVLAEGYPMRFGRQWLSLDQISLISTFWTLTSMGVLLGWLVAGSKFTKSSNPRKIARWMAVLIGLLIVPSHLIWKPYFVISMPLAIWILHDCVASKKWQNCVFALFLFIFMNLTTYDFVGHRWATYFEAACLMLFTHLAMIGYLITNSNRNLSKMGYSQNFYRFN